MKRGHVTGEKRVQKRSAGWYQAIEQANIDVVEHVWEEQAAIAAVVNEIPRHMRDSEEE